MPLISRRSLLQALAALPAQALMKGAAPGQTLVHRKPKPLPQGAVASYTFANVTGNHTITASFAIDQFAVNVTVVGSGYVGTVVSACLASLGHDVVGLEVDAAKGHSGAVPLRHRLERDQGDRGDNRGTTGAVIGEVVTGARRRR